VSGKALNARSRPYAWRGTQAGTQAGKHARGTGRRGLPVVLPALAAALVLLAGCSGTPAGAPHAAAAAPATASPSSTASPVPARGVIRLVVEPGPVQNGNVDPQVDWVTPFEKQTGCVVELRNASTDAQAVNDVNRGIGRSYYDGVLGSPEVLGQLAAARALQPLDVQRIAGYAALSPRLRSAPSELFGGQVYGMPYSWDSYVTGYDVGQVQPAPQSWSALFAPASAARYAGKIILPDSPVTLALAALYLKSAEPSLGISDPFELTKPQLAAAVQAVSAVRPSVGTFWDQDSVVVGQLGDGQDLLGAVLSHQIVEMSRAGLPTAGVPSPTAAAGPGTVVGEVLSWMVTSKAPETDCMYRWLSWSASASVQERVSAWTANAPASPAACRGPAAANCAEFHESGLAAARNIVFDHLPAIDCGTGQTGCTGYAQWQADWRHLTGEPAAVG
jgi:putative spermidine/putrescine transport system substrate-binding protein